MFIDLDFCNSSDDFRIDHIPVDSLDVLRHIKFVDVILSGKHIFFLSKPGSLS